MQTRRIFLSLAAIPAALLGGLGFRRWTKHDEPVQEFVVLEQDDPKTGDVLTTSEMTPPQRKTYEKFKASRKRHRKD
jgi:hypothetical protein